MTPDPHWLTVPPVICGCLSAIACIYVCVSAIHLGYVPCKRIQQKIPRALSWRSLQQKLARNMVYEIPEPNRAASVSAHPTQMVDILFWMCVSDGLHSVQIMVCVMYHL